MSQGIRLEEEEPLLDADSKDAKTPGQNYAESLDYSRPYNKVLAARLKNPPPQLSFLGSAPDSLLASAISTH